MEESKDVKWCSLGYDYATCKRVCGGNCVGCGHSITVIKKRMAKIRSGEFLTDSNGRKYLYVGR